LRQKENTRKIPQQEPGDNLDGDTCYVPEVETAISTVDEYCHATQRTESPVFPTEGDVNSTIGI
jgi:hypothetical protein